jgi:hypothetical protein
MMSLFYYILSAVLSVLSLVTVLKPDHQIQAGILAIMALQTLTIARSGRD